MKKIITNTVVLFLFLCPSIVYANSNGWQTIKNEKYYFNSEGSMVKGIYEINGEKYLFGVESGKLYCNGLAQTPDGKIYITDNKGRIQYGWQTINNKKYYFNSEGSMVK